VIAINIIDFGYIPIDDFHARYHLWEDRHKDSMLSDVCEIHFLDMVKFRRLKDKKPRTDFSLNDPLHRWLIYFDEHSSPEMVEEVLKMDTAIQMVQEKMDMIARDPALLRAYEQYEKAASDYTSGVNGARREEKIETARKMKADNMPSGQISKYTGLSDDEIQKL
jgi:predicted transposase/invertase (TIGR01784 family)